LKYSFFKVSPSCAPSDRLSHIVQLGLKAEDQLEQARRSSIVVTDNVQDIGKLFLSLIDYGKQIDRFLFD